MINKWGYGVFKWSSGNYYKGNYRNDERDGYGEMYWMDGSSYKGQWHNNIQHGFGTMIFNDGTFIKGYFKNNVFLNANAIPEKLRDNSDERPIIEAEIYNLPRIPKSLHKSSIGIYPVPVLEDVRSKNISLKNSIFKRVVPVFRSKNNSLNSDLNMPNISKFELY